MRSASHPRHPSPSFRRARHPPADARRRPRSGGARDPLPAHQLRSPGFSPPRHRRLEEAIAEWDDDFDNPAFTTFVAVVDGRVVGSAVGCSVEVSSLHTGIVRPDAADSSASRPCSRMRAVGVGSALGTTVLDWAAAEGYRESPPTGARRTCSRRARGRSSGFGRPSSGSSAPSRDLGGPARVVGWGRARIPLLSGSRVPLVTVDDDALLLIPPSRSIHSATWRRQSARRSAIRSRALRSPISSRPAAGSRSSSSLARCRFPVRRDPRRAALGAVIDQLERLGMPAERHTILIAGEGSNTGPVAVSSRRCSPRRGRATSAARWWCTMPRAVIYACSSSTAAPRCGSTRPVDADLVVCVTAAETSGARRREHASCRLLRRGHRLGRSRSVASRSVALAHGTPGGPSCRRTHARGTAVMGVSIALDHPRLTGRYRGYPSSPALSRQSHARRCDGSPTRFRGRFATSDCRSSGVS